MKRVMSAVGLTLLFLLVACQGLPAEELTLVTDKGARYAVDRALERDLLLVFMSFDCNGCLKALPRLAEIDQQLPTDIEMVGAIFQAEQQELAAKARELKIGFPLALGSRELAEKYGVKRTPTLLWFDRQWQVRGRYIGEAMISQLGTCLSQGGDHCRGIVEILEKTAADKEQEIVTGGLLVIKEQRYYLTNGSEKIEVLSWLPQESVPQMPRERQKSPLQARGKTMQSLIGQVVTVTGRVQTGPVIKVKNAIRQVD